MVDLNNKDYIREVQDVSGYYITKDGKVWSSKRNKWLEARKIDGAVQMPFSWMAYWYRRLHNATN